MKTKKNKFKSKYEYVEEEPKYYHNSKFNLKIDKSNIEIAGSGVFTNDLIPPNTFIDYYKGIKKYHSMCGNYFFAINKSIGIDEIGRAHV